MTQPHLRESATFDRATIADIQRAARTGVYDIRGLRRQAASCRTSTTCCSSERPSPGTRWRATGSGATPTWSSATGTPGTRSTCRSRSPSRE